MQNVVFLWNAFRTYSHYRSLLGSVRLSNITQSSLSHHAHHHTHHHYPHASPHGTSKPAPGRHRARDPSKAAHQRSYAESDQDEESVDEESSTHDKRASATSSPIPTAAATATASPSGAASPPAANHSPAAGTPPPPAVATGTPSSPSISPTPASSHGERPASARAELKAAIAHRRRVEQGPPVVGDETLARLTADAAERPLSEEELEDIVEYLGLHPSATKYFLQSQQYAARAAKKSTGGADRSANKDESGSAGGSSGDGSAASGTRT
jgi:hypothetical protein